jgi:LmbE family N-acetylglucosaminyl deacetylase
MNLQDFMPLPDLESCRSLLCIQPHPDDNEVGAGATIARLAAKGCRITYLTVTDGGCGTLNPAEKPEDLVFKRKSEIERAAEILGVSSLLFLSYQDTEYPSEKELCQSIVGMIRKVQPEMVMTVDPFLPYEAHPDHRKIGMAVLEACLFSQFPHFHSLNENVPASGWQIQGVALHSSAHPNTFINVDDTWELKFKALMAHESQFNAASLEPLQYYFNLKARQYAKDKGFSRAEAFKLLTTNHLHMNVDTINL